MYVIHGYYYHDNISDCNHRKKLHTIWYFQTHKSQDTFEIIIICELKFTVFLANFSNCKSLVQRFNDKTFCSLTK